MCLARKNMIHLCLCTRIELLLTYRTFDWPSTSDRQRRERETLHTHSPLHCVLVHQGGAQDGSPRQVPPSQKKMTRRHAPWQQPAHTTQRQSNRRSQQAPGKTDGTTVRAPSTSKRESCVLSIVALRECRKRLTHPWLVVACALFHQAAAPPSCRLACDSPLGNKFAYSLLSRRDSVILPHFFAFTERVGG